MVTEQSLQGRLAEKVREVKDLVSSVGADGAARKPAPEEWCVNEVLSHLIGEEIGEWRSRVEAILNEDTPFIDLTPGLTYPVAHGQTTEKLLASFENEYTEMGRRFEGLTEEQLNRKAHVPLFKETPIGAYPTLAQFAGAIINFHLNAHIEQLKNLCRE